MTLATELLVDLPRAASARMAERLARLAATSRRRFAGGELVRGVAARRRRGTPAPSYVPVSKLTADLWRNFDAGMIDRLRAGWATSEGSVNSQIYAALVPMRTRSRDHASNNPWHARWGDLIERNTAGPRGVRFQSRAMRGESPDFADRTMLERAFEDWSRRGNFDTTGRLSRAAAERLFMRIASRDGEVLVRLRRGYTGNPWRYAVQFIDAARLDHAMNEERGPNGRRVVMGVEIDDDDRATGYYLLRQIPGVTQSYVSHSGGVRDYVPASEMIHAFIVHHAEQLRGVPWAHASMLTLEDFAGFAEAAVVNARAGAQKLGWFQLNGDEPPPADEYVTDGSGARVPIQDAEAGTFGTLPSGTELVEWKPAFPDATIDPFSSMMLRGAAMGLGVEYHTLTGDLAKVNFATGRIGGLTERDLWLVLQDFLIDHFPRVVYPDWLRYQLTIGGLENPNGTPVPATAYRKLLNVRWQGRRWQYYQPLQEAHAHASQVGNRTRSRTAIADEQGLVFRDIIDEIRDEEAYMREQGVDPTRTVQFQPTEDDDEGLGDDTESSL